MKYLIMIAQPETDRYEPLGLLEQSKLTMSDVSLMLQNFLITERFKSWTKNEEGLTNLAIENIVKLISNNTETLFLEQDTPICLLANHSDIKGELWVKVFNLPNISDDGIVYRTIPNQTLYVKHNNIKTILNAKTHICLNRGELIKSITKYIATNISNPRQLDMILHSTIDTLVRNGKLAITIGNDIFELELTTDNLQISDIYNN